MLPTNPDKHEMTARNSQRATTPVSITRNRWQPGNTQQGMLTAAAATRSTSALPSSSSSSYIPGPPPTRQNRRPSIGSFFDPAVLHDHSYIKLACACAKQIPFKLVPVVWHREEDAALAISRILATVNTELYEPEPTAANSTLQLDIRAYGVEGIRLWEKSRLSGACRTFEERVYRNNMFIRGVFRVEVMDERDWMWMTEFVLNFIDSAVLGIEVTVVPLPRA